MRSRGELPQHDKKYYDLYTANTKLVVEKGSFPLISGVRQAVLPSSVLFNTALGCQSDKLGKRKIINSMQTGKEEVKLSLLIML